MRSCLFRSSDPVGRSSLFRSSEPRGLVQWGVLATSNLFRSAGPRTGVRSCLFRSSDPVGRSSLFRSSEPRGWVEVILSGWVGVILGFSLAAASLLVKSSKPMDFLECCLWLRRCPLVTARLRFRYSEPRNVGVARLSSRPRPATSLLYRSSEPLDFRLVASGCPQDHCWRRACVGPHTTGLEGSGTVLDTASSDE